MNKREYRSFDLNKRGEEAADYSVEGYAATFKPYVLFTDGNNEYKEVIDPHAFDDTDFTDCVFRVDHEGQVYARTSNGTIEVTPDKNGLFQKTDLSKTEKARSLYEDIKAGMYPKMSFAFTVSDEEYDAKNLTRTIKKIDKVYDVSAVTWPANPDTNIDVSLRDAFDGAIEAQRRSDLEAEKKRRKAALRKKLIKEILEDAK